MRNNHKITGWTTRITTFSLLCLWASVANADPSVTKRPLAESGPTPVKATVLILDVDSIDSAHQNFSANVVLRLGWKDPRLARNGGEGNAIYDLQEVWHPRVRVVNQQKAWQTFPEQVEVSPDGDVVYRQRLWGTFAQPLRLHRFPFDEHTFQIQLVATGYQPHEVNLVDDDRYVSSIVSNLSLADWTVQDWKSVTTPYSPAPGYPAYTSYTFSFQAKRLIGYYLFKVILPLGLIVMMSWIVFWIDPKESGIQISVSITSMLTLIAYRFMVGTMLPRVSYLTRLDYFILASTLLVFTSLLEVITTYTLARSDRLTLARSIDRWSRLAFPLVAVVIFMASLW
jgi:hypothetical protein